MQVVVDNFDFDKIQIVDENGMVETYSLSQELRINEMNVPNEYLQQSAKYIYWASILEKVRMYLDASELNSEIKKAECYTKSRDDLVEKGVLKPTKDQIEHAVMLDDDYVQALREVQGYTHLVKQLQYVVKAFEQRKDMLIQYGAELRKQKDYMGAVRT